MVFLKFFLVLTLILIFKTTPEGKFSGSSTTSKSAMVESAMLWSTRTKRAGTDLGLLDELVAQHQSPEDRMMQLAPFLRAQGQAPAQNSLVDYAAPPGRGIFGNDQPDPLNANDPRLVDRFGVTLARPAMRSITEIMRTLGLHGDIGGGYRTAAEQAGMNPALAAPVGQSYHQEGLAIDLAQQFQTAAMERALRQAGWNQFSPQGEPWHWSYGVTG